MQLDEVVRTLYAAAPDTFVADRDAFVRQAREAGDKKLAAELRKLRRPTQSAWLVNLLWYERRELVEELLAIGAQFRDGELTRQRMNELAAVRRDLLNRLVGEAGELSERAGAKFGDDKARDVEATLGAAVADSDAADQLRSGRLTTALSYSGFGPQLQLVPDLPAAAHGRAGAPGSDGSGDSGGRAAGDDTAAPSKPSTAVDDERARRRVAEAKAAVRSAERVVADRTRAHDKAELRRDKLARRQQELRTELELVQSRLAVVDGELDAAEQAVRDSADKLDEAQRELEAARGAL